MKIISKSCDIQKEAADMLAVGIFTGGSGHEYRKCGEVESVYREIAATRDFTGKSGEIAILYPESFAARRLLLVGLGPKNDWDISSLRPRVGGLVEALKQHQTRRLLVLLDSFLQENVGIEQAARTVTEVTILGTYLYDALKSVKKELFPPKELVLACNKKQDIRRIRLAGRLGQVTANAANFARELQNTPGNLLTPKKMASKAVRLAKETNLKCRILGEREIRAAKMGALLGVAKGSKEPPRFIVLEYKSRQTRAEKIVLVGKGVTFDSGGISIKPSAKMEEMKFDMSGAAAVLGAIKAVAELALPIDVVALVPAVENLPGASALKPGDILKARSGKTIEIINTDAEGRLILADALNYARKFRPNAVIDLATLTGACTIALGSHATGLMGNDQALIDSLLVAGQASDERLWQLPLWQDYFDDIKGDYADIKNSGGRGGGAITAAAFLGNFTQGLPWAHLDIAGTAWINKKMGCLEKGGTGVGVRLLVQFLLNRVAKR